MGKIAFDKYYTPPNVAKWCIDKTFEVLGRNTITEIVEPSAGCGMFSHQLIGCKAYDLYPQHEYIEQADFLKLDLGYKKGRLFIGNPPFGGSTGKLVREFYNKCVKEGDYIAFILPSNYHKNYKRFYKFEIVYSVLIKTGYSGVELYTSFVIYKRNAIRDDWRDDKVVLKDITLTKYIRSNKKEFKYKKVGEYDYCFKMFGNPLLAETEPYKHAGTLTIQIHQKALKDQIIGCIKFLEKKNKEDNFLCVKNISTQCLDIEDFKKLLKICIPEIK